MNILIYKSGFSLCGYVQIIYKFINKIKSNKYNVQKF